MENEFAKSVVANHQESFNKIASMADDLEYTIGKLVDKLTGRSTAEAFKIEFKEDGLFWIMAILREKREEMHQVTRILRCLEGQVLARDLPPMVGVDLGVEQTAILFNKREKKP